MTRRHPFRYVNELAGGFVLLIVVLVIASILVMGNSQRWFTPVKELSLTLPDEGSLGLRKGADVMVLGTVVGSVDGIDVDEAGDMQAQIHVRSDFMRFVRMDSVFTIRQALGIGDAYIQISKGKGDEIPVGFVKRVEADQAPTQMVQDMITQVRSEAIPTLKQARVISEQLAILTKQLNDPSGEFQQIVTHANHIAAGVDKGDGLAGKLVADKGLADDATSSVTRLNASLASAEQILTDVHQSSARLPQIMASTDESLKQLPELEKQTQAAILQMQTVLKTLQASTADLPVTVKSVNETLAALPGLVVQTQETLRQTQKLVQNAQQSFLFGGGAPEAPESSRISSQRVGTGGGGQ